MEIKQQWDKDKVSHWSHFQQFARHWELKGTTQVPLRISELTGNNPELTDQPGPPQTGSTQLQERAGEIKMICAAPDVNFCPPFSFISLLFYTFLLISIYFTHSY